MLIAEVLLLWLLFAVICFAGTGGDTKNIRSFASYPDEVQELVRRRDDLRDKIPQLSPVRSFLSNFLTFGVVLFLFGLPLRTNSWMENFVVLTVLGQSVNVFDLLVLDLLWWRHTPRVRFTGTEARPELYRPAGKHVISFAKGIVLFLLVAVVDGALLSCF